jgi:hypothetical protein
MLTTRPPPRWAIAGQAGGRLLGAGPVGDEDAEAVLGQARGARATDPTRRAGDECHPHAPAASRTQRLRWRPRPVIAPSITSPSVRNLR